MNIMDICPIGATGHEGEMSVTGYIKRPLIHRLHHYAFGKAHDPHCFSRLCSAMSACLVHPHEVCLFSAMCFSE